MATLSAPMAYLPIESLPIAAAGLDGNGAILIANQRFFRLFRIAPADGRAHTLADMVAEVHREAVMLAQAQVSEDLPGSSVAHVNVQRSNDPGLWLGLDIVRLTPDCLFLSHYLVCAQPLIKNRRNDKISGAAHVLG